VEYKRSTVEYEWSIAEYSGVQAEYVEYGGVLEYRSPAFSPLAWVPTFTLNTSTLLSVRVS
jgi:hypothetical protein